MHHPALPTSSTNLSSHVHKTANLPPHIPTLHISPILPPLTTKDTTLRRLLPQHLLRTIHVRQRPPWFSWVSIILEGAVTSECRVCCVKHWLVDYAYDRLVVETEGDGDAEHREQVRVVYCSVQWVDDPCWRGGYEIVFR